MRLLVVSSWFPYPPDNGTRLRTYHLLRHLARRHEISLLSFGEPTPEDLRDAREFVQEVACVAPWQRPGASPGLRGLLSPTPRHFVQTDSVEMRRLVARAVAGKDAAIGQSVQAARYLHSCRTLPRVFEEVEVAVLREQCTRAPDLRSRLRYGLTWWKHRAFVRRLVDGFERATTVSSVERDLLGEIGCDVARVAVVPNGVDVESKRPSGGPRVPRLIYPGAVTYFANLDAVRFFANEILPLVRQARPDLEFLVTGETGDVDVSDLVAVGVTFTGRLPDVDEAVGRSAACVVPLRIGGGTRLKVLEAMALGAPVVSTSKGIEGLEVGPERHALVADTPADFARQVLRLLGDPSLADRLTRDARRLVEERYSWMHCGELLEGVLDEAMRSHRR
jgi:glycosyltransferase involved in cell wall biosynthesis